MNLINLRHSSVPTSLRGWILCDHALRPRFWSTIWSDAIKSNWALSTKLNSLHAINRLYETADELIGPGALDTALTKGQFEIIRSVLSAHFQRLRNLAYQNDSNHSKSWNYAYQFVNDILLQTSIASSETEWAVMRMELDRMIRLFGQLTPRRTRAPKPIRSLSARVLVELYEIFDPISARNPFKTQRIKYRNFLIFLMLLHLGLRRGEVLILASNSLQDEFDPTQNRQRFWLHVSTLDDDLMQDPRAHPPSLKTNNSVRILPVSAEVVDVLDVYLGGYRQKVSTSALFTSQKRLPLSLRQVDRIFEVASEHLTPAAKAEQIRKLGRPTVCPHDLRHTAAVRRMAGYKALGYDDSSAVEKLRVFFGWSMSSPMPRHYARAHYETEFDEIWQDRYDIYVEAIRALENVE